MTFALALLIGFFGGLRALTAPADELGVMP
ncbi:MAG: hypothetical protein QOF64_2251 [Candidatus Binatota bacterium]|jgi:uncharacterized membrane protein|nr:hypothetical protein [Candidatus Binatota bacterium]